RESHNKNNSVVIDDDREQEVNDEEDFHYGRGIGEAKRDVQLVGDHIVQQEQ
ncbi:unnamed protein product, partial [Amoebophrya sp. A25]